MKTINSNNVADAVLLCIPRLASVMPPDVRAALEHAREVETGERARIVLQQLCDNAELAESEHLPICQDTGSVWVCLEVGPDISLDGNVFSKVNSAVAGAYNTARLRKSLVRDALLDRSNTGDNTPAFCELRFVNKPGCARLHIMLKGGGSDNASRLIMLPPSAGKQGVKEAVLETVREKASSACPPLVVGVGVGSTFDKVANLSKRALMRPLDKPSSNPEINAFEQELLDAINGLGLGAGALGGDITALGVRVKTAPCHIAALPVAVNMGCCALRRITVEL